VQHSFPSFELIEAFDEESESQFSIWPIAGRVPVERIVNELRVRPGLDFLVSQLGKTHPRKDSFIERDPEYVLSLQMN